LFKYIFLALAAIVGIVVAVYAAYAVGTYAFGPLVGFVFRFPWLFVAVLALLGILVLKLERKSLKGEEDSGTGE